MLTSMAERIEIELDPLTSAYLHHYAQRWNKDLSEAATIWLQTQAKGWEFKQKVSAEFEEYKVTEDRDAIEAEEAERAAEDWVARFLSEAGEVNTEALTYAYRALGAEVERRGDA